MAAEDGGEMPANDVLDYLDLVCNATDAESVDLAMVRFYRQHRSRMNHEAGKRRKELRSRRARLRQWQRMRWAIRRCVAPLLRAVSCQNLVSWYSSELQRWAGG